jgi:hypothetical protein
MLLIKKRLKSMKESAFLYFGAPEMMNLGRWIEAASLP